MSAGCAGLCQWRRRVRVSGRWAVRRASAVADFIADQRTSHQVPHAVSCRALEVSQSWLYKWLRRPPTARDERRAELVAAVREVFDRSGGTYGSPRVHAELRERGWRVSKNTIAKLMAELGLAGRVKRRRRSLTRQGKRPVAPDLVQRDFTAQVPDVRWCGDMTEIDTGEGKLYLATVIDLHSRRLLGYAMDAHLTPNSWSPRCGWLPQPAAAPSLTWCFTRTAAVRADSTDRRNTGLR
ncbi:IS3 family transposase [Streptomyces sp. CB02959]|uniref:IS3 family transposase n=1 Tax=Streptomyces sp. CB02959 TaxID=2020330 RepID=UPI0021534957|nr:IS3 family transposase [Streptomyces sp. CB02959]